MKKTKFGDYERVVTFTVWSEYDVHIVFTEDIGRSRKARYGTYGLCDSAGALHVSAEHGHAHIFFKLSGAPTGIIAHECWHAIYHMMIEWAGVTELDNEAVAYHLGYLVQKVIDFREALIHSGVFAPGWDDKQALRQSKVLGVKSSSRKQATHGNESSQRIVAGMQEKRK